MASDLEMALKALNGKGAEYDRLFRYYDGKQPLTYLNSRLKEIFRGLDAYFVENWCSVVVDACRDRINLREVQAGEGETEETWVRLWEENELKLESDEVHEAAMVTGESFVIAWPNEAGVMEAYYNDPRLCHVFYEAQYPRRMRFAAKWWQAEDGTVRLTLYYPDRLEYYRTKQKAPVERASAFVVDEEMEGGQAGNPYGEIPVFHFRAMGRRVKSDLVNVIPVQNGINKLLTDMMVTGEYAAFPQRYIISNAEVRGQLKNAPNEVWDLPGGDGMGQQTQAGQFPAANLENYLKAIDNLATAISSITRTPKHYFFAIGSNLSGEALVAMEAPLNKKAQDRIDRFIPVWQRLASFMLRASGHQVEQRQVQVVYDRPETVQPVTDMQTLMYGVQAGVPLITQLRRRGWSETEIGQLKADQEAERKTTKALGDNLLNAFDRGEE